MHEARSYFLYVEDDEDDRLLFRNILGRDNPGMDISFVNNGFEAIEFLQSIGPGATYPAVIVLDLHMPRLDGLQTLELLRSDDIYRLIPVILFTATSDAEILRCCSRLGAELLNKPDSFSGWNLVISKVAAFMDN